MFLPRDACCSVCRSVKQYGCGFVKLRTFLKFIQQSQTICKMFITRKLELNLTPMEIRTEYVSNPIGGVAFDSRLLF